MEKYLEINLILKEFYKVSGFRISIHDTEFNEIYSYPQKLSEYCAVIQSNENNRNRCIKNDKLAFEKVKKSGEVYMYRCSHGLFEAVAPIYHYGILSGYFMIGQVCDDIKKHSKQLKESIYSVISDFEETERIISTVKEVPEEHINSYITLMTVIAEYITQTNRVFSGNDNIGVLVMKYITQNYAAKITLPILAEKFSCSQSLLVKSFKKEYNSTIMGELMRIRLEKAANYLKNSRLSIKEIATKCGFSEQNYFSKSFSEKYGCSPIKYRNTSCE